MAKAVNEEWAPGCHTRVVAKIVDGSGDCDPVGSIAQSPWYAPSRCALWNRAFLRTFLKGENGV